MLGSGEHADKSTEYQLEAALCVLGRQNRDRWLFSDDELQFRDEVHHEPSIRPYRLTQCLTPAIQLGIALAQQRADQALKGLG